MTPNVLIHQPPEGVRWNDGLGRICEMKLSMVLITEFWSDGKDERTVRCALGADEFDCFAVIFSDLIG